jgi:hypothetical protein
MTNEEERAKAWRKEHEDLVLRLAKTITSLLSGQRVGAGLRGLVTVEETSGVRSCPCSLAYSLLPMGVPGENAEQAQAEFATLLALINHPTDLVLGMLAIGAALYAATIRAGGPEQFAALVASQEVP